MTAWNRSTGWPRCVSVAPGTDEADQLASVPPMRCTLPMGHEGPHTVALIASWTDTTRRIEGYASPEGGRI